MTQDEFWQHIHATRRRDPDEHAERLAARLAKLPVESILDFGARWAEAHAQCATSELWGAAFLINGGCTDEEFVGFRSWLLLQGQTVVQAALANPDTLVDHLRGDSDVDVECQPAEDAYCAITGKDDYDDALKAHRQDDSQGGSTNLVWSYVDENALQMAFPRLYAAYYEGDD